MARAMAPAIAPAMRLPMAEGIGGSDGQAKPLPIPVVTHLFPSQCKTESEITVTARAGFGIGESR